MRPMLFARGLIGLWLGVRIALLPANGWPRVYDMLADYLVLDGIVALLVSAAFVREGMRTGASRERTLGAMLFVDGAGRAVSGTALHAFPGISDFPVTAVLLVSVMAVCTALVGLSEAAMVVREEIERHGRFHARAQLPAVPIAAASVVSIAFGIAAMVALGDPTEAVRHPGPDARPASSGRDPLPPTHRRRIGPCLSFRHDQ